MPELKGLYPAPTYVPKDRLAHFGLDYRVRCTACDKVVFENEAGAAASAERATLRGTPMRAYLGPCGHWHTTRTRRKK